jgi:hypothetical protein
MSGVAGFLVPPLLLLATITIPPVGSFNRIVPEKFSRIKVTQSLNKRIPNHKLFKTAG